MWVQALSDSVQLLTSLSSQSPDNWLQMGWALRDSDGQFLLGVHQLDWRLAEPADS